MRTFLPDINIYGTVLLSRSSHVMHYCIKDLLKYCNKVLLVLDNEDEETQRVAYRYAEKYKEINVVHSQIPGTTKEQEEQDRMCVYNRFKALQGPVRQVVLNELKKRIEGGEKIDLIIWPDHDECFSGNLPSVLEKFWNSSYKELTMKAVDVFFDFTTIHNAGMTNHGRIWKYDTNLLADPHRWGCHLIPIGRAERTGDAYTLIHLSLLGRDMIDWKQKYWSRTNMDMTLPLWRVGKDVRECTPEEIRATYARDADTNIGEFLHGGDKRMPVGRENLRKALVESSEILSEMGIKPVLLFGTALMLYRDQEFKSWEFDLDMGIFAEDLVKFNEKAFLDKGWTEYKLKRDAPKFIKEGGIVSEELVIRTISFQKYSCRVDLDILYMSADGKNRLIMKGRKREKFCAEYNAEWFYRLNFVKYMDKEYLLPGDTDQYIESNYGKDWRIPKYEPADWTNRTCKKKYYEIA